MADTYYPYDRWRYLGVVVPKMPPNPPLRRLDLIFDIEQESIRKQAADYYIEHVAMTPRPDIRTVLDFQPKEER